MENPCKIACFGDSITKAWTDMFRQAITAEYPNVDVVNEGAISDTTNDALQRIDKVLDHKPDVVAVAFGMNDWRKGIDRVTFINNMTSIADTLKSRNIRVILLTMNPDNTTDSISKDLLQYNKDIRNIAYDKKIRIADIESLWLKELPNITDGLYDEIHPNEKGNKLIIETLMRILPRSNTTIVW